MNFHVRYDGGEEEFPVPKKHLRSESSVNISPRDGNYDGLGMDRKFRSLRDSVVYTKMNYGKSKHDDNAEIYGRKKILTNQSSLPVIGDEVFIHSVTILNSELVGYGFKFIDYYINDFIFALFYIHILQTYGNDLEQFPAMIEKVNDDGTYDARCKNGRLVSKIDLNDLGYFYESVEIGKPGERVECEALMNNTTQRFPATIKSVNEDGTYEIRYTTVASSSINVGLHLSFLNEIYCNRYPNGAIGHNMNNRNLSFVDRGNRIQLQQQRPSQRRKENDSPRKKHVQFSGADSNHYYRHDDFAVEQRSSLKSTERRVSDVGGRYNRISELTNSFNKLMTSGQSIGENRGILQASSGEFQRFLANASEITAEAMQAATLVTRAVGSLTGSNIDTDGRIVAGDVVGDSKENAKVYSTKDVAPKSADSARDKTSYPFQHFDVIGYHPKGSNQFEPLSRVHHVENDLIEGDTVTLQFTARSTNTVTCQSFFYICV